MVVVRKILYFLTLFVLVLMTLRVFKLDRGPRPTPTKSVVLTAIRGADVAALAKKSSQPLTLINLWASWCMPCRDEFPELVNFYREHHLSGIDLKFISMDFKDQQSDAEEFLKSEGVDFETFIKDEGDDTFIRSMDASWQGTLPTTYLFDKSGKQLARWERPLSDRELEKLTQSYILK